MKRTNLFRLIITIPILVLILSSCKKDYGSYDQVSGGGTTYNNSYGGSTDYSSGGNTMFYLLVDGLALDGYSTSNPTSIKSSATITGLQSGERILGIDFRPATGQLYGVGSTSRIYVINPLTGGARMIGAAPFTPAIAGTRVGFDFNPTVDRIRLVTNTGQNLRINPETGAVVAVDGSINGQTGADIGGVAYYNNKAGATTTILYDVDVVSDKLFRQDPPNAGTLVAVGSLNVDVDGEGGFDIASYNDAMAIFKVNGKSTLLRVDLNSGSARVEASYLKNYTGIAIGTQSVAYAASSTNNLLIFSLPSYSSGSTSYGGSSSYDNTVVTKTITGLQAGETILGLDMRPRNGQLYALGSTSKIYTINASSGAATLAASLTTPLSGLNFGFDFNPVVDRIRIVSNTGQNLRFNPNDNTLLVDGNTNPGTPSITAVAYNNNFAGTTTTMLFAIDDTNDNLYRLNPPNAGTLELVGSLGINIGASNGFDYGGTSGNAYALFNNGNTTNVYRIDTNTGKASQTGSIGSNVINGFTIGLGF